MFEQMCKETYENFATTVILFQTSLQNFSKFFLHNATFFHAFLEKTYAKQNFFLMK